MSNCELCGEPMPVGEEMFKFHGFSGPCPAPPLSKLHSKAVIEYALREDRDGQFWIGITRDRDESHEMGPFANEGEARAAYADLLSMMRSIGAQDALTQ